MEHQENCFAQHLSLIDQTDLCTAAVFGLIPVVTPTNVEEGMEFPLTVEEGCVFAMGDNRNRSMDSRAPEIGQIDQREILGQAVYLFFPGTGEGEYGGDRDFSRIGVLN